MNNTVTKVVILWTELPLDKDTLYHIHQLTIKDNKETNKKLALNQWKIFYRPI